MSSNLFNDVILNQNFSHFVNLFTRFGWCKIVQNISAFMALGFTSIWKEQFLNVLNCIEEFSNMDTFFLVFHNGILTNSNRIFESNDNNVSHTRFEIEILKPKDFSIRLVSQIIHYRMCSLSLLLINSVLLDTCRYFIDNLFFFKKIVNQNFLNFRGTMLNGLHNTQCVYFRVFFAQLRLCIAV